MISVDLRVPAPPHVRATAGPRRATPPPRRRGEYWSVSRLGLGSLSGSFESCTSAATNSRLHSPHERSEDDGLDDRLERSDRGCAEVVSRWAWSSRPPSASGGVSLGCIHVVEPGRRDVHCGGLRWGRRGRPSGWREHCRRSMDGSPQGSDSREPRHRHPPVVRKTGKTRHTAEGAGGRVRVTAQTTRPRGGPPRVSVRCSKPRAASSTILRP